MLFCFFALQNKILCSNKNARKEMRKLCKIGKVLVKSGFLEKTLANMNVFMYNL